MKSLIFLAVSAMTFSASAIQTLTGVLNQKGLDYECSYYNGTEGALNIKYAIFTIQQVSGDSLPQQHNVDVNKIIEPGETVSVEGDLPTGFTAQSCLFVTR